MIAIQTKKNKKQNISDILVHTKNGAKLVCSGNGPTHDSSGEKGFRRGMRKKKARTLAAAFRREG